MVTLEELGTPRKSTWCPGCGNFGILTAFKNALIELGVEREQVVIVSGIGCHGKMVNYVNVNGFHGIHGRVIPLASGIKMANPGLIVVGFAGDGDCYDEGWGHFAHGIRRNVDITILVHDNKVFGLTTGQTTSTSEPGFVSKTTPEGSKLPSLNPIANVIVNHGTFVARGFPGDLAHLKHLIVQAIRHRGFSLIDILQPCVSFNRVNTYQFYRKRIYKLEETDHDPADIQQALERSFEWGDRIPIGVFYQARRATFDETKDHIKSPVALQTGPGETEQLLREAG